MPDSPSLPTIEPPPGFIASNIGQHRHFFANLTPSQATGLLVSCGGWEHCSPSYVVDRKKFPFHAIEFVSQGRGELTINGKAEPLYPGSIFTYAPETSHCMRSSQNEPMVKYFVDFTGKDAHKMTEGLRKAGVIQVARIDVVRGWFDQLLEAGEQASPESLRICSLLTELIIRHAASNPYRNNGDIGSVSLTAYERCRAMLHRDFLSLKSAGELASLCHIDVAYMTRLFQRHGNESPYQMLVRLKMNRAAEMLVTSGKTLMEIGEAIGVPDPFHFSRVFKRNYGISPKAFREGYHRKSSTDEHSTALHI